MPVPGQKSVRVGLPGLTFWIVLGVGTFFALLSGPVRFSPLARMEMWVQDRFQEALPTSQVSPELLFVALDEESVTLSPLLDEEIAEERALQLMNGGFPWSREVYALLIDKLLDAGARAVVLDVSFPGPLTPEGDAALAAALERHAGRVVIASVFENNVPGKTMLSLPSETLIAEGWGDPRVGYASFWPDFDHVVRRAHDWQTLSGATGKASHPGEMSLPSLGTAGLRQAGSEVPEPDGSSRAVRFARQGSFPIVPLWSVFHGDSWERNLRGGAVFQDRIVLVGPTAARFLDFHRTPVAEAMSGPEVHLQSMSNLLTGQRLEFAPWWLGACLSYVAAALAAWLVGRAGSPWKGLARLLGALLVYGVLVGALLAFVDFLVPVFLPSSALVLCGLLIFARDFATARRERTRVRRTLERYVSRDIVREVLDAPGSFLAQLGGVRKQVVVLFSDLRGFTSLTENSEPVELVAQLNEYLGRMVDAVFAGHGTIDKFIGDAVMAVWGTVVEADPAENARRAVRSAAKMLAELGELNRLWAASGRPTLKLGIGLHAGEAVFGNMGSEQKMEPTVIGDTVNLASRTESLCKKYGVPLLFTGSVREALGEEFTVRRIDLVRVVGRSQPVELFSLAVDGNGGAMDSVGCETMDEIIGMYRAGNFQGALEGLAKLEAEEKADALSGIYQRRIELALTAPDAWNPVHDWTEK